jgi:hypothetical protein
MPQKEAPFVKRSDQVREALMRVRDVQNTLAKVLGRRDLAQFEMPWLDEMIGGAVKSTDEAMDILRALAREDLD